MRYITSNQLTNECRRHTPQSIELTHYLYSHYTQHNYSHNIKELTNKFHVTQH